MSLSELRSRGIWQLIPTDQTFVARKYAAQAYDPSASMRAALHYMKKRYYNMIEPVLYETAAPPQLRVLTWPEASSIALAQLVGPENVREAPASAEDLARLGWHKSIVQIRNSDSDWVTLYPGWLVAVTSDGKCFVASPNGLSILQYQPVQSQE
jgi:hypothetical protein